jgi:hypothetical protein
MAAELHRKVMDNSSFHAEHSNYFRASQSVLILVVKSTRVVLLVAEVAEVARAFVVLIPRITNG